LNRNKKRKVTCESDSPLVHCCEGTFSMNRTPPPPDELSPPSLFPSTVLANPIADPAGTGDNFTEFVKFDHQLHSCHRDVTWHVDGMWLTKMCAARSRVRCRRQARVVGNKEGREDVVGSGQDSSRRLGDDSLFNLRKLQSWALPRAMMTNTRTCRTVSTVTVNILSPPLSPLFVTFPSWPPHTTTM